ncbi:hypothetical protein BGX29_008684 [Mortierella sp. GBA35]|nr:hypothetical protein BGX29_008684 [Mortierella sp. GBA35]
MFKRVKGLTFHVNTGYDGIIGLIETDPSDEDEAIQETIEKGDSLCHIEPRHSRIVMDDNAMHARKLRASGIIQQLRDHHAPIINPDSPKVRRQGTEEDLREQEFLATGPYQTDYESLHHHLEVKKDHYLSKDDTVGVFAMAGFCDEWYDLGRDRLTPPIGSHRLGLPITAASCSAAIQSVPSQPTVDTHGFSTTRNQGSSYPVVMIHSGPENLRRRRFLHLLLWLPRIILQAAVLSSNPRNASKSSNLNLAHKIFKEPDFLWFRENLIRTMSDVLNTDPNITDLVRTIQRPDVQNWMLHQQEEM